MLYAQAIDNGGSYTLGPNDIWIVPKGHDVHFDAVTGSGPHAPLIAIKGLVFDYKTGRIFGIRKASEIHPEGYIARGRVSVGGKKHPCWTGKRLFQRPDGSLCEAEVLFVTLPETTNP